MLFDPGEKNRKKKQKKRFGEGGKLYLFRKEGGAKKALILLLGKGKSTKEK